MAQLVAQRIVTPDGTILQSFHRHDYRQYQDENGEYYVVDGGIDYLRGSVNIEPATPYHVYTSDKHTVIRNAFMWGTYGKDGKQPLKYIQLNMLETSHIEAILKTQSHLPSWAIKIFQDELDFRNI